MLEMAHFSHSLRAMCSRARETAHGGLMLLFWASDVEKCAISALSAAQRGPWGPHRPIVRAGAAACGVELAAARALSASARAHVIHGHFLARVLSGTRPESRPAANTSARSVVELT